MRGGVLFAGSFLLLFSGLVPAAESFRVWPYLQNPATDAISIRWVTQTATPGTVHVRGPEFAQQLSSTPRVAAELRYNPFGPESGGPHPEPPAVHAVRVTGLRPGTAYTYTVTQGSSEYSGEFRTTPDRDQPIRFMVYADSETEPESSTTEPVDWPAPAGGSRPASRTRYFVNQTTGYQENLKIIAARRPDFVCIAGDLVESGGEQRDWDEFWRHLAGDLGKLATRVPFFTALGNHENFGGPGAFGGYSAEAADFGVGKFLTYFEVPANGASAPHHHGRYYRVDYGPLALLTIDSSDGLPHQTAADTNHNLSGSRAPDFNPGSEQYAWIERQLAEAQRRGRFTCVQFHHTPYGSGPHSIPFGKENFSGQSGIALRVLQPLLMKYGVDAVFCGHDEMLERSLVTGQETTPDGRTRDHQIHFYDTGIGGDGLRGPVTGFDNPHRQFLAHEHAREVWEEGRLVSGGKHYGHLEVNVFRGADGRWRMRLEPVHAFPLNDAQGKVTGWERRVYADVVELFAQE